MCFFIRFRILGVLRIWCCLVFDAFWGLVAWCLVLLVFGGLWFGFLGLWICCFDSYLLCFEFLFVTVDVVVLLQRIWYFVLVCLVGLVWWFWFCFVF